MPRQARGPSAWVWSRWRRIPPSPSCPACSSCRWRTRVAASPSCVSTAVSTVTRSRRARLWIALGLLLASPAHAGAQGAPVVFPAPDRPVASITSPTYSDEKTRDTHGEAERVMDRLGVAPGKRVADIGAGVGHYTVRLVRRLGPGATVYATDINREFLGQLQARLHKERIQGRSEERRVGKGWKWRSATRS